MWCSPGPAAGRDRGGGHRRHRRERRDAVVDVAAALEQRCERRRLALGDRPLEHAGFSASMTARTSFFGRTHRRIRRPAYFSPSRRRPPSSSTTKPADHEERERRDEDRERRRRPARRPRRRPAARRRLGVEPRAHALARGARDREPAERGAGGPTTSPGHESSPLSASAPANSSAPSTSADHAREELGRASADVLRRPGGRFAAERSTTSQRRPAPATASRNAGRSRNAKSVPSKSMPMSARGERAASSGGRKGRMPMAAARPAPWRCRGRGHGA